VAETARQICEAAVSPRYKASTLLFTSLQGTRFGGREGVAFLGKPPLARNADSDVVYLRVCLDGGVELAHRA
jgi:hypothetical protein